jgi:hypothetical protein
VSEVSIQLLHVPGCPLVDGVRTTLRQALAKVQLHATATVTVEERVGDYPSPTLLIDGRDVTGRPHDQLRRGACRLDLPTERQVLSALERLTAAGCPQTPAPGAEEEGCCRASSDVGEHNGGDEGGDR